MAAKLSFDKDFFNCIDSAQKAYWLGFIYADGNIFKKCLQIVVKDKEIIKNFKDAIKSDHKIIKVWNKEHQKFYYRLAIVDENLIKQLNQLGIIERKSLIIEFPNSNILPDSFLGSFLLGAFDGDGSIASYQPKEGKTKWSFSFIGTKSFCEIYNKILSVQCDLFESKVIKYKRLSDKNIWEIRICGVYIDKLKRIYNFLYGNDINCLRRKRERIIQLIKNGEKEPYSSIYYGVQKMKNTGKWKVCRKINGKRYHKQSFETEKEAAIYHDNLIRNLGADLRYLNFSDNYVLR